MPAIEPRWRSGVWARLRSQGRAGLAAGLVAGDGGGEADVFRAARRIPTAPASPSVAREMAMRVLLKADSMPASCGLSCLSSSVISTLWRPLESSATLPGVAEVRISALSGADDRREAVGEGAEAALIGIAPGGVDHDELGAGALFLDRVEHGFDADAFAPHVGFLPDPGIDRDHVALAAGLHAVAAEVQHHHGIGLDLGLQTGDGAEHVVLAGVLDDVDVKAAACAAWR